MRLRRSRRRAHERILDQILEDALTSGELTRDSYIGALVSTSGLLYANVPIRERRRQATKQRMLMEAQTMWNERPRGGGGTKDSPTLSVHTAQVELPDGRVTLADVESISQERAEQTAREVANYDETHEGH